MTPVIAMTEGLIGSAQSQLASAGVSIASLVAQAGGHGVDVAAVRGHADAQAGEAVVVAGERADDVLAGLGMTDGPSLAARGDAQALAGIGPFAAGLAVAVDQADIVIDPAQP